MPVRIAVPAEHGPPQMPGVVRQQVEPWIAPPQPAGEQVEGERKAVHFRKQRHQKGGKGPKRAPVAPAVWMGKAEGKVRNTAEFRTTSIQRP